MNTRHLIDPEIVPLIDMIPAMVLTPETLPLVRQGMAALDPPVNPACAPQFRRTEVTSTSPGVDLFVYNLVPERTGRPLILHIHGGGMVFGSPRMSQQSLPPVLAAVDAVGISVDYRLAPESPFPGPQEDCYAALSWAVEHAEELGIDPSRIVVTGDSAGGGLAAAVAIMARDRGNIHLAGQALIYPMIDHRTGGPNDVWRNAFAGEFVWTRENNVFGWASLKGSYTVDDERAPYFSPALIEDMSGLPPTLILAGGLDLFVDENLDFARRLTAAGVPTELHLYPKVIHGFNASPDAAIAMTAARDYTAGIARILSMN